MKINILKSFEKDYKRLPTEIKNKIILKLKMLEKNQFYPSLRSKKIQGREHIWEGSINMSYRFTYEIKEGEMFLRRAGTHAVLNNP